MEIASLYAKVSANTSDYDKSMRNVRADLQETQGAMSKLGDFGAAAFKTIAVGAVAAGAAVTGIIAKSVNAAGSLEQQAANISAVFGDIAPPVNEVKDAINKLALDPTLVVGVEDAGAGLEMLAKNGLTWQQIADGAARSSILLANATGADLATSADLTTNALGIFGLQVSDLNNVVATFTNAANKSQFDITDWGYVLANAGPAANALGYNLEELFAAVTLTSSGFASGREAGTSFEYLMKGLTPSTQVATDAMMELGLMTADGANQFFNADGSAKSLDQTLSLLQGAFNKLSVEQRMAYSETIFGNSAYGALEGVLNLNLDTFKELIPTMTDFGAVEKGAETRTNTYQAAMAALGDTFNSVFAMIGDKFLPMFTKLARGFATFVKDNAQPIVDFFGRFADGMSSTLDSVVAAVGAFQSRFSLELATITSDNASWGDRMEALWHIIATSGATIWQTLIDGLSRQLPQWLDTLVEWGAAAWQWIVDNAPIALQKLGEWASGLWGWIAENLPTWINTLAMWAVAAWQWLVDITPTVVTKLGEWGTALYTWLSANLPIWVTTLGTWASAAWQWIADVTPTAVTKLGEWGSALWAWLKTNAPILIQRLGEWATAAWQWIVDATPEVVAKLGEWGSAIWTWLLANGPTWFTSLVAWTQAAWQWVVDATAPLRMALGDLWKEIDFFITLFKVHWAILDSTNASVVDRLKIAWYALQGIFGVVFTAIDGWLQSISGGFLRWSDIAIGSVLALTVMFWPAISGAFMAVVGAVGAFVAAWAPILALFAAAIVAVALVRTAWETDWLGIRTATLEALDFMGKAFAPFLEIIQKFGVAALKEIGAWVTGNDTDFAAVKKIWEAAKTSFGTVFDAIGAKIKEWGEAAWEWFSGKFPKASAAMIEAVNKIKANFDEFWKVLQPLIQKFKNAFDSYRENWENNSGKMGAALENLKRFLDGIWTIMITAAGLAINNLIDVLTLIIQFINGDWAGAWETIKQIGKNTWDALKTIVGAAVDAILAIFGLSLEDVQGWLDATAKILQTWFDNFTGWLSGLRDAALTKMGELRDNVVNPITNFVDATKTKVGEWKDWVVQKYVDLRDAVKEKMEAFRDNVINPVKQFADDTKTKIGEWKDWLVEKYGLIRDDIKEKMDSLKENVIAPVTAFVDSTKTKIGEWKDWLIEKYATVRDNIKEKMEAFRDNIITPVQTFVDSTKTKIGEWKDWVVEKYIAVRDSIKEKMDAFRDNVITPVTNFIDSTKEKISEWKDWLIEKWVSIRDKVKEYMDKVKEYVIDPIVGFVTATKDKIIEWKDWLVEKFGQVRDSIKEKLDPQKWLEWGRDLIEGLWNGLKEKWGSLVNWFGGAWDNLVSGFKDFFGIHSPSTLFASYGSSLIEGLTNGINAAAQLPINAMSSLATQVQGQVTNMVNSVKNSASQITGAIPNIGTPAPTPNNAPPVGGIPLVIPQTMTGDAYELAHFGEKIFKTALEGLEGLGDTTNIWGQLSKFAIDAADAIYAATGMVIDAPTRDAVETARFAGNQQVDTLLAAVQLLVQKLGEVGLGSAPQFNIGAAPDAALRDDYEVRALVAYLQAMYS